MKLKRVFHLNAITCLSITRIIHILFCENKIGMVEGNNIIIIIVRIFNNIKFCEFFSHEEMMIKVQKKKSWE